MAATEAKADLNSIPYDAPLSIAQPSASWVRTQTRKGNNSNRISEASVPGADLTGKWIIVTGANNGIGREAALQFAAWGANLVLACRQPPPRERNPADVVEECKARAKTEVQVEWWEIDMAELASVEGFAKRWLESGRALDVLCNNAGIGSNPGKDKIARTVDGFEIVHQVNFTSHVLLTTSLLPALAKAKEPRIVCTTSCFHYPGKFNLAAFNGDENDMANLGVQLYQNNKLWYQIWLTELQHRLLQHDNLKHITVNGIHPGFVNSGIWNLNSYAPFREFFVKILVYFLAINEQQGSLAITHCATSPQGGANLKLQGVGSEEGLGGGKYFNRIWEAEPMPHTKDRDCRLRVWRKVNDELKLKDKGLLDTLGLEATDL